MTHIEGIVRLVSTEGDNDTLYLEVEKYGGGTAKVAIGLQSFVERVLKNEEASIVLYDDEAEAMGGMGEDSISVRRVFRNLPIIAQY